MGTTLITMEDSHFAWLLGEAPAPDPNLRLPPGGLETAETIARLRIYAAQLHESDCHGFWMIVDDGEIAGTVGYKHPPGKDHVVEIGYGLAESRRRLGHATRAVAALMAYAHDDPAVSCVVAKTHTDNVPSQKVLEKNGFENLGPYTDPVHGEVILWRLAAE
ncbi:MAG TPA: GNAT family N-acetyltransferase [Rhizomicrobium sp.]|nr:GNAT family N-acetyltransferase [Rhizomicrobium sp.]